MVTLLIKWYLRWEALHRQTVEQPWNWKRPRPSSRESSIALNERNNGREQYINNFSVPVWVPTKHQVADIFTKALDKTTFLKFRAALLNLDYEHYSPEIKELIS